MTKSTRIAGLAHIGIRVSEFDRSIAFYRAVTTPGGYIGMKALILLIVSGILAAGVFIAGKQAGSEQLAPLLILFWQMSGGRCW